MAVLPQLENPKIFSPPCRKSLCLISKGGKEYFLILKRTDYSPEILKAPRDRQVSALRARLQIKEPTGSFICRRALNQVGC